LRKSTKKPPVPKPDGDTIEPGLRVPTSALDGCLESFTAADEKRVKASTTIFADTGIMGLLCRHDNVLWLVNMTTAGERQYFAIALLLKLFRHLPDNMHVGVLYDVACQLHRSCVKWGFLNEYIHHILWSVSVFHAYGHQWPCQLIYHPRKCCGFGLSDGEGCERFWDAIKLLIPALRVSGVSSHSTVNLPA
jgi:Kyakuja-Dileera-Zisupton transposase